MQSKIYAQNSFYHELNAFARANQKQIARWFDEQYSKTSRPIFVSTDIRNAGFKVAHVDANLFPAGFNNLSTQAFNRATDQLQPYLKTKFPGVKKVLLVPENFSYCTDNAAMIGAAAYFLWKKFGKKIFVDQVHPNARLDLKEFLKNL